MKEFSIEEKARRYDEAVKVISKCGTDKYGCIVGIKPSDLFPELIEEENEIWIDRACMLLDELNHLSTLTLAKIPSNVNDIISHLKSLKHR